MRRPGLGVLGCLVGAGLIVSGVSPVWATEGEPPGEPALVGGFGLGDGLEGSFDEQSGAFKFGVPAGGVNLGWDSRALGSDRHGLGDGWGLGLASVQVDGGLLVFPAAGGVYPADTSSPSGLAGYTLGDVRFEQTPGVLPVRDDGTRGEVEYAYVLHELGGTATYFSASGDPVAQLEPAGARADWVWADGAEHRLAELIDADGVVTALTWNLEGGELLIRPGANMAEPGASWTVLMHGGRITGTIDPGGARTDIRSEASGLVTGIAGPSGAQTDVQWRPHLDGVARVERVRTLDAVGTELSARSWRPTAEAALASGWPMRDGGAPWAPAAGVGGTGFSTVVGDRKTEVESTYNALGSLIRRVTSGTTSAGRVVLKEQSFQYPGTDEAGTPTVPAGELPKHWANPIAATSTVRDAEGGERVATLHTEFDEFGRLVRKTVSDGEAAYSGAKQTFDDLGRTVAQITATGDRTDWAWAPGSPHKLTQLIDPDGVFTSLDWDVQRDAVMVRRGSNLPGGGEPWTIRLDRGQVTGTTDPTGGRVDVTTDAAGAVAGVSGGSGSRTEILWRPHTDGVLRVEQLVTSGADGAAWSTRSWRPVGVALPTGWPLTEAGVPAGTAGVPAALSAEHTTVVGDGETEVASTYNALGSLTERVTTGTTGSGRRVLQEQTFRYPGTDEHGTPTVRADDLPKAWSRPSRATISYRDDHGGERSGTQTTEFDDFGRLTQRIDRTPDTRATDNGGQRPLASTRTTYVYDAFNRLTGSTIHAGDSSDAPVTSTTVYTVSVAGDVADETVTTDPGTADEQTNRRAFEYSPAGALTAITTSDRDGTTRVSQEYDTDGNLVRAPDGTAFTYDASNRVTSRTGVDGVTTHTSYWADGSRHALTTDAGAGASTAFYWDGDTLLNDTHTGTADGEDAGTASYLIGAIRHARTITAGDPDRPDHRTSYLGTDRHGNTTDLADEHGTITTRYAYTDYGITTETHVAETSREASAPRVGDAIRNPFQYAAAHADPSGDLHLRTRAYDADTMRFTTPDPAPMLTDYAYGGLNPITNVDPSGRAEIGDHIINGALIGVALITGFLTATSIGLPTGGMSYGAYAAWAVGAFSVLGDVASTGIAIAQIVHDAGVRFMSNEQREILNISGIVIGAVSALAGPIAAGVKRRFAHEDDNAWNMAFNRPNQKFDTSPVRPHQLEALLPRHVARLFGKKFEYHIDTLPPRFESSKENLRAFARSFDLGEMSELDAYDLWFFKTKDDEFNFAFEQIARLARNDVHSLMPLDGARAAKRTVDAAITAIKEDKKTIDSVLREWTIYKDAPREPAVDLFPAE